MSPYITFRDYDKEGKLQYYILQREFPHYVGVVSSIPIAGNWYTPIIGYAMYIVFGGVLRGMYIPDYKNIGEEVMAIMENMAAWYYDNRISIDEKRYKKFKITTNVQGNA